jgi:IclR family transcriptional regulator, mhp operon transcriptional activator
MDESPIRSLARGLAVLRTMNRAQRWSLHQLHGELNLPKTTLFRILQALQGEGYVRADVARSQYMLTAKVCELSGGYTEQSRVIAAGSAIALRMTREVIKWPLAIGVRDGDSMVVGYSTMPYSPLAVHSTTVGHRLSLALSAMGQAYLAHCSAVEREQLLAMLSLQDEDEDGQRKRPVALSTRLARIVADGYAVRRPESHGESATLAVPICHQGEAIAALGMTTFGRTMSARLVQQHVPILLRTAVEIAAAYASGDGTGTL